jgi:HAD superfamily hydrolase (TIGR01549 family)
MGIKSLSDFYKYSLFIFDLDNTIYDEEDYLFQAYKAISQKLAGFALGYNENDLLAIILEIYSKEGRDKLFDKFLFRVGLDITYITECLKILRSFNPELSIEIKSKVKNILASLIEKKKPVFVLTNGNPEQQMNKIRNIRWDGLDKTISFIMADEFEPKPSPSGIIHILNITGSEKKEAIMTGDMETDKESALNGGIDFINIFDLARLV